MNTEYDWAKIYNDALLETDWPRIEEKSRKRITKSERGSTNSR